MKVFLLLEPPFSTISLELEDIAALKKYSYFSFSDVYVAEAAGETELSKKIKELKNSGPDLPANFAYRFIIEKYLQKPPKNNPNGFVLDPDCFSSAEELLILLEILNKYGHQLFAFDIEVSPEECAEYIEDFGVDESEGIIEIAEYFEVLYPEFRKILLSKEIETEYLSSDEDPRQLQKRVMEFLS